MRTPFDKVGKQIMHEALTPTGPVETEAEVTSETRRIDIWYRPEPDAPPPKPALGLLARMAAGPRAIERHSRCRSIDSGPQPRIGRRFDQAFA